MVPTGSERDNVRRLVRWAFVLAVVMRATPAAPLLPEPDAVYYGYGLYDAQPLVAGSKVRATAGGATLDEYQLAPPELPGQGNLFVLRVPLDFGEPRAQGKAQVGDQVTISVAPAAGGTERTVGTVRIDGRGIVARIDFDARPRGAGTPIPGLTPQPIGEGTPMATSTMTRTPTFCPTLTPRSCGGGSVLVCTGSAASCTQACVCATPTTPAGEPPTPTPTPTTGCFRGPSTKLVGDCNGDDQVKASEIQTMIYRNVGCGQQAAQSCAVTLSSGVLSVPACANGEYGTADGLLKASEIQRAILNNLAGCR